MVKNTFVLKTLTTLTLTGLAFAPVCQAGSAALQQCEASKTASANYLRCLDGKIDQLDNQTSQWRNNITYQLQARSKQNGRTDTLRLFQKSQKNFKKYLEQHCRWQYLILLPDPTASAIKYKECAIILSEQRISQLKQAAQKP